MFASLQKLKLVFLLISLAAVSGCRSAANFGLFPASQSFGQKITFNNQVDILVVVDTSGSMGAKQAQLSQQFYPFISHLAQSQFDFHIGVITMDMSGSGAQGALVGSPTVLTNSTPNLQQAFVNNVSQGTNGSDLSRGLLAVQTALSNNMLNGPNAGFLRSSALLAIIFLSDEDDGSVNSSQSYESFLDTVKPPFPYGARGWIANSIVVPSLTDQCKTYNQFASPGLRYMDLSTNSSGIVESICAPDLVQASSDIQDRILEMLTVYHLDRAADPTSIKVFINGVAINSDPVNGWTFDVPSNSITFHGAAIPAANANVQVSFQPTQIQH